MNLLSSLKVLKREHWKAIEEILECKGPGNAFFHLINNELSNDNPWFIELGTNEENPQLYCLLSCRKDFIIASSLNFNELKEFAESLGKEVIKSIP